MSPRDNQVTETMKNDLIAYFLQYKSNRSNLFTNFFFRNTKLTKEKVELVDKIIECIKGFEGSLADLNSYLSNKVEANKAMSNTAGKFHTNLISRYFNPTSSKNHGDGYTNKKYSDGYSYFDPNYNGSRQSGLAKALSYAINYLDKRIEPQPAPSAPPLILTK